MDRCGHFAADAPSAAQAPGVTPDEQTTALIAWTFDQETNGGFRAKRSGGRFSPCDDPTMEMPSMPADMVEVESLCRGQVANARAAHRELLERKQGIFGGRLVVFELGKDSTTVTGACSLDEASAER